MAAAAAIAIALMTVAAGLLRALAWRVLGVEPRRKTIEVRRVGDDLEMPRSAMTLAAGNYGLWFGERFEHHALVGPVVASDSDHVVRRLIKSTAPIDSEFLEAQWTGHTMSGPAEIDTDWEEVAVPLRDGSHAPAWLFHGKTLDGPWVVHVQGIRTSRLVTLRSVDVVTRVDLTSLVITYRGAGDGPPAAASTLGQREWSDLADAIAYARSHGATTVNVVAWSMGAGLALELLRREPQAFERLALIAPATNWRRIIRHGVKVAGFPAFVGSVVIWALGSRVASRMIGVSRPLDFDLLDWSRGMGLNASTLILHSRGDEEVPFDLTRDFVAAHPSSKVVETAPAPHGWEANVDPEVFRSALTSWLLTPSGTDSTN